MDSERLSQDIVSDVSLSTAEIIYKKQKEILERTQKTKKGKMDLQQYLQKMSISFTNWYIKYKNLEKKKLNDPNKYRSIQIDHIKRGYNLLISFEQYFNIHINYLLFLDAEKTQDGNLYFTIPIKTPLLKGDSSEIPVQRAFTIKTFQKIESYSKIIPISVKDKEDSINYFYAIERELKGIKYSLTDGVDQNIQDFIQTLNQLEKQKNSNFLNIGILGEILISAFLTNGHLKDIYTHYTLWRKKEGDKEQPGLVNKEELPKITKDLDNNISYDTSSFFSTGDFEYIKIWRALFQHNKTIKDLINANHSDFEEGKELLNLYNNYKNIKFQIKEQGVSGVNNGTIVNYCKMLGEILSQPSFIQMIEGQEKDFFSQLLQSTEGASATNYRNQLIKNLTPLKEELNKSLKIDIS